MPEYRALVESKLIKLEQKQLPLQKDNKNDEKIRRMLQN